MPSIENGNLVVTIKLGTSKEMENTQKLLTCYETGKLFDLKEMIEDILEGRRKNNVPRGTSKRKEEKPEKC